MKTIIRTAIAALSIGSIGPAFADAGGGEATIRSAERAAMQNPHSQVVLAYQFPAYQNRGDNVG